MHESALHDLGRAPTNIRKGFAEKVALSLRRNPYPTEDGIIRKLKNTKLFRYKLGNWWILFEIIEDSDEPSVKIHLLDDKKVFYKRADYNIDEEDFELETYKNNNLDKLREKIPSSEERGKAILKLANEAKSSLDDDKIDKPIDPKVKENLIEKLLFHGVDEEDFELFTDLETDSDLLSAISQLPKNISGLLLQSIYPQKLSVSSQGKVRRDFSLEDIENLDNNINFESFNLDFDPGQKRFINRFKNAKNRPKGPYQIKGAPGSGKSTVALYAMCELLKEEKNKKILFVSYTKALVGVAENLMEKMNPTLKAIYKTADSICFKIYNESNNRVAIKRENNAIRILEKAIMLCFQPGPPQHGMSNRLKQNVAQYFSPDDIEDVNFLYNEIKDIILGRGIEVFDEYKNTNRKGRSKGLNSSQRRAVWTIFEAFQMYLYEKDMCLWEHHHLIASKFSKPEFDYVFIDEAQDLTPAAITALIKKSYTPENVFIAIDKNQSIYRSNFEWSVVKDSNDNPINFTGKTTILKQNHRTTKQIWSLALNLLENPILSNIAKGMGLEEMSVDKETLEDSNPPKNTGEEPTLALIEPEDQARFIEYWLMKGMKEESVGLSGCVILVPNKSIGEKFENLIRPSFNPKFMVGEALANNIDYTGLKITTYHAAKGWGFPLVVIAGIGVSQQAFDSCGRTDGQKNKDSTNLIGFPKSPALWFEPNSSEDSIFWESNTNEKLDPILEEIRLFYTASTRAGRRLLYIMNKEKPSILHNIVESGCILHDENWYRYL